MEIEISNNLKELYSTINLAVVEADVTIQPSKQDFIAEFNKYADEFKAKNKIEDIAKIPAIYNTRLAYKAFGKQPARYRVSSEAMLRRIVQGKGLYYINNIVDVNNYVSVKTGYGICCFDKEKIIGDNIEFCLSPEGESYKGIGKNDINISKLPVFKDSLGYFGSPTSDSQRTMITNDTKSILFVIVSFSEKTSLGNALNLSLACLEKFANANIKKSSIL
ncbi:MAG: phenylalanine--tRNA ligase beta subunit-related protein [Marinifilaceae bacterium]|jgi:DNA/RNA-binding domain of Phe-tRNA-synthetase-like protein|nr:phenylalanine--tRNA ligase beta subunit-related protein [Marinifilaceae bacterium]